MIELNIISHKNDDKMIIRKQDFQPFIKSTIGQSL